MNRPLRFEMRPMTLADVDRVMEIAAGLASAPQWPRKTWMKMFEPDAVPRRIALVADYPKLESESVDQSTPGIASVNIQGFAVANLLAPEAELEVVAVANQSQRQGLGSRLLAALTERLREAGASEILLEVRVSNQAAIGLYRSLGFRPSGVRERYYVDPIEDAVVMAMRL